MRETEGTLKTIFEAVGSVDFLEKSSSLDDDTTVEQDFPRAKFFHWTGTMLQMKNQLRHKAAAFPDNKYIQGKYTGEAVVKLVIYDASYAQAIEDYQAKHGWDARLPVYSFCVNYVDDAGSFCGFSVFGMEVNGQIKFNLAVARDVEKKSDELPVYNWGHDELFHQKLFQSTSPFTGTNAELLEVIHEKINSNSLSALLMDLIIGPLNEIGGDSLSLSPEYLEQLDSRFCAGCNVDHRDVKKAQLREWVEIARHILPNHPGLEQGIEQLQVQSEEDMDFFEKEAFAELIQRLHDDLKGYIEALNDVALEDRSRLLNVNTNLLRSLQAELRAVERQSQDNLDENALYEARLEAHQCRMNVYRDASMPGLLIDQFGRVASALLCIGSDEQTKSDHLAMLVNVLGVNLALFHDPLDTDSFYELLQVLHFGFSSLATLDADWADLGNELRRLVQVIQWTEITRAAQALLPQDEQLLNSLRLMQDKIDQNEDVFFESFVHELTVLNEVIVARLHESGNVTHQQAYQALWTAISNEQTLNDDLNIPFLRQQRALFYHVFASNPSPVVTNFFPSSALVEHARYEKNKFEFMQAIKNCPHSVLKAQGEAVWKAFVAKELSFGLSDVLVGAEVFSQCTLALTQPENLQHVDALLVKARMLPGHESAGWKKISYALVAFSCTVLLVASALSAVPTCGLSLCFMGLAVGGLGLLLAERVSKKARPKGLSHEVANFASTMRLLQRRQQMPGRIEADREPVLDEESLDSTVTFN